MGVRGPLGIKILLQDYREFVAQSDSDLVNVLEAVSSTDSFHAAQELLGMNDVEFNHCRCRLKILKERFLAAAQPVPKPVVSIDSHPPFGTASAPIPSAV